MEITRTASCSSTNLYVESLCALLGIMITSAVLWRTGGGASMMRPVIVWIPATSSHLAALRSHQASHHIWRQGGGCLAMSDSNNEQLTLLTLLALLV